MRELHEELSKRIARRNLTASNAANKQRIEGPTFKEGDRVFLSRQNLKTRRPCRKLDNLRVGPLEILEKVGPVNYKLRLPPGMKVHPVFHKKLLEPAPQDAELAEDIELENDEYIVEEVKDLRKIRRQWKYLVKWQGWPDSQNTWEPEENLTNCKSLVREYHRKHPRKREPDSRRKGRSLGTNNQKKDRRNQPVTRLDQPTIRIAMVRQQEGSYPQGLSSPRPALSHDLGQQLSQDHDARNHASYSSPLEAHDANETTQPQLGLDAPQPGPAPTLYAHTQLGLLPTLSQKQTNYTQHQPRYTQHNALKTFPRSSEASSLHSVCTENPFQHPPVLLAQHEYASVQSKSGHGEHGAFGPWAWLGRLESGRNGYNGPGPTDLICSQRFNTRHGKMIFQGIETIALRGEVMLQVTRRILSLTNDEMAEGLWTSTSEGNDHRGARIT
ncbi:hypothetical protein ACJBU6_05630 [Exserohilum turcicum]